MILKQLKSYLFVRAHLEVEAIRGFRKREVVAAFTLLLCNYQLRMTGPEPLINTSGLLGGIIKTYKREDRDISERPPCASRMGAPKLRGSTTGQGGSLWLAFEA